MSDDFAQWGDALQRALEQLLGSSRFEDVLGRFLPANVRVQIKEVCLAADLPGASLIRGLPEHGVVVELVDEYSDRTAPFMVPVIER